MARSPSAASHHRFKRLAVLLLLLLALGLVAGVLNAETLARWRYGHEPTDTLVAQARTHSDDLLLVELTGERLLAEERGQEAGDLLLPAAERHPDRVRLAVLAGRAAWKLGDEARAGALLHRAVELAPTDPQARFWMGEFLRGRGYSHEALDLYREVVRLNPQFGLAWCRIGEVEREDEHNEEALAALNRAEQLDPTSDTAYHRAAALQALGRLPEAEQSARLAYQRRRTVETASLLGKIIQLTPGADRLREAQGYLREAAQLDPKAAETLKLLAINQRTLGEHAAAVKTLRRMLRVAPAMTEGYLLLSQSYQALGKHAESRQVLQTFRKLETLETRVARAEYQSNIRKGSPESQKALARTYMEVGRQDMAREVLERLLRKRPEDGEAAALLRQAQGPPTLKIAPLPADPEGDAA
jgi:tetratricopeptide (TPR) repeat protein